MKLLFTALACLLSLSVFGQSEPLLHKAYLDSLTGYIDESGEVEIWQPGVAISDPQELFHQVFALFANIKRKIYLYGEKIDEDVYESDDCKSLTVEYEHRLECVNEDTLILHMVVFEEEGMIDYNHFTTEIDIKSNNNIIASNYSLVTKFYSDKPEQESEAVYKIDSNYITLNYIEYDYDIISEGYSYEIYHNHETCTLSIYCDFNCVVNQLHQANYNFESNFKGE